jgi:hypothetical protein
MRLANVSRAALILPACTVERRWIDECLDLNAVIFSTV